MPDTDYSVVTLNVATLTLGETIQAERQSGMTLQEIMRSQSARKLLAMFVHELRTSEQPRSWHDLSSLRLLDVSPSRSGKRSAEVSTT